MSYKTLLDMDLDFFRGFIPPHRLLKDEENLDRCSRDETEAYCFPPDLVLQPETTEEVSKIIAYCNAYRIPVTPRGAGTGLSGGALPIEGGVCLDMKRMNKIEKIDAANFLVVTQPGVITQLLQEALISRGLFYPVDPASSGSCFIGGNIAENSGGPRAVKYGTAKDYVLNLEVVLASGEVIWTGANTLKNATGYNLTQLIVGSEGTLAVITKIVLRLLPYPEHNLLMLAPFPSSEAACKAVNRIMMAGFNPSALEFMERDALQCAQAYIRDDTFVIPESVAAHLLIEVDGNDQDGLFKEMEGILNVLSEFTSEEVLVAQDRVQKERLWRLRRSVGEAVKHSSIYKEEDTVVPRAYLPELLRLVKECGSKDGFRSVCYGHAGDGNLHINILKDGLTEDFWNNKLPDTIRAIFMFVHSLGGTISGEHGIGYVQKEFMDIVFPKTHLELMQKIKNVFDSKGILNPGKILPTVG
jgi:glycolate oxidase